MNKHLTDAELQLRMMAHTKQVVDMVTELFSAPYQPRQFGEADDTYTIRTEDRAQTIFFDALAVFRSKVQDAMTLTDIEKDSLRYLLDALDDHSPNRDRWEEKAREC